MLKLLIETLVKAFAEKSKLQINVTNPTKILDVNVPTNDLMKLSGLNLPKIEEVELDRFDFIHRSDNYLSKLTYQYASLIDGTETGRKIIEILSEDPRVKELNGKVVSNGGSSGQFSVHDLGRWFLWFANKVGSVKAEEALNNFLDNSEIQVINCLWVLGLNVDQEVNLCEDINLVPVEKMPDSNEKKKFLQFGV